MRTKEEEITEENQIASMNRLLYPDYDNLSEEEYFSPLEVFKQEIRRRVCGTALLNQGVDTDPIIWILSPWSFENFCRREAEELVWQDEALDVL